MKNRAICVLSRLLVIAIAVGFSSVSRLEAQSISRQVIGIMGSSSQFNNIKVSWTAGEAIIGNAISTNGQTKATIGFQQPDLSILSTATSEKILVNISPNPTPDLVNVTLLDPSLRHLRLTLTNTQGQVIIPSLLLEPWKNEVDLSQFPPGVYYLNVSDQEATFQTYQIIKIK